jgi:hypothetical protein
MNILLLIEITIIDFNVLHLMEHWKKLNQFIKKGNNFQMSKK